MKPINKNNINNLTTEQELTKKLRLILILLITVSVIIALTFTVFATNFGSIFKIFSKKTETTELVIKPTAPVLNIETNNTNKEYTNIKGYSGADYKISLFVNGPLTQEITADENGYFEFSNIKLINGRNVIFAKATNNKNVESDATESYIINLDTKEPEIEIESPKDDDNIKNLNNRITIKGSINEKATIKINDQITIIKPDLTFEHLLGVQEGDIEIKIVALDEAGNEATEEIKVSYQKKNN